MILRRFYNEHGIVHAKSQRTTWTGFRRFKSLEAQRSAFAVRLAQLLRQQTPLIFCDETTFSLWQGLRQVWTSREHPITLPLATTRG